MSQSLYSSLSPGPDSIRLLRLMPLEYMGIERTEIQCDLFKYLLQDQGKRTHLYEALSYVWGGSEKRISISINNQSLAVTENLYTALSHLRDRSLERILWVDAICINQNDKNERAQQVELMAKIYSKAHRVIVWLGKNIEDSEEALEDICRATSGDSIERSRKNVNEQAIFDLLQRPWFQRIWVLQEVAAARHIVLMCGFMEIDGYAFCLGLKSLKLSYPASPKFQSLPSLTGLIERASLRFKYITNSEETFSLKIGSLPKLIDMFHTREASDVRDKVYALLGMSSDDPGKAGLRPNYHISWAQLFQQLVKFVIGKDISVETCDYCQRAVFTSKGWILGQVCSVTSDNRQNVTIISRNTAWYPHVMREWILQASVKSVREGDIVCLLQGASKPTIIRRCKDYFAVVVIAATSLDESGSLGPELSKSTTHFLRDFLLVWDWENPLDDPQGQEEYETWTKNSHSKAELGDYLEKGTRIWNVALVLGDLEQYKEAEERLREAIEGYEKAIGEEYPRALKSQYGLTPLSWAAGNGYNVVVKLLLKKDGVDPDLKDSQYGRTPLSWAAEKGHEGVVKLLLETGKVNPDLEDYYYQTPLLWAANKGHEGVVKLLLEMGNVDLDLKDSQYSRTPLSWAAEKGHEGVVHLLLEIGKVNPDSNDWDGRTPLSWAAEKGHEGVIKLLLEMGKVNPDQEDYHHRQTPLSWAAKEGHEGVVKLLLKMGKVNPDSKNKYGQTPLSWAAEKGHKGVVKLLLETGKVDPGSKVLSRQTPLSFAAIGGYEGVVKLLLEMGKVNPDSKDRDGRTPLSWAAEEGLEGVVKLLLETGKVNPDSKDWEGQTPVSWAAKEGHEGVVKLLLETGKVNPDLKDWEGQTPVSWPAKGGHEGAIKLLLEASKVEVGLKNKDNSDAALIGS